MAGLHKETSEELYRNLPDHARNNRPLVFRERAQKTFTYLSEQGLGMLTLLLLTSNAFTFLIIQTPTAYRIIPQIIDTELEMM